MSGPTDAQRAAADPEWEHIPGAPSSSNEGNSNQSDPHAACLAESDRLRAVLSEVNNELSRRGHGRVSSAVQQRVKSALLEDDVNPDDSKAIRQSRIARARLVPERIVGELEQLETENEQLRKLLADARAITNGETANERA